MASKSGLTLEQHQALGARLRDAYDVILKGSLEVQKAYQLNSDQARRAVVARRAVEDWRSSMETALFRENAYSDEALWKIYFPEIEQGES